MRILFLGDVVGPAGVTFLKRALPAVVAISLALEQFFEDNKLDPESIAGSGRDGRITRELKGEECTEHNIVAGALNVNPVPEKAA